MLTFLELYRTASRKDADTPSHQPCGVYSPMPLLNRQTQNMASRLMSASFLQLPWAAGVYKPYGASAQGRGRRDPHAEVCRDATRRAGRRVLPRFSQKRVLPPAPRKENDTHRDKNTPSPLLFFLLPSVAARLPPIGTRVRPHPPPGPPPRAAMDGLHGTDACFSPASAISPQVVRPPGPPDVGR